MRGRRQAWFDAQPDLDPAHLVFIDETGASTKMARLRGRAQRGQRCRSPVPHGHWKTTTFTGALRLTGMTAPMVLDGPMNADAFRAYVRHVLAPTLQPGDIVVMDNLPAHKVSDIRALIEATGDPGCCTCRPTLQTSTRSRTLSPSSRPSFARPPRAASPNCGTPSAAPLISSHQPSAPTTSPPQDTSRNERILL